MSERRSLEERYGRIIDLLRGLARGRRYSPIDRMARAISPQFVTLALYEALRVAASEGLRSPPPEEVSLFLEEAERNPTVAQKVAVLALAGVPAAGEESGAGGGG